MKKERGGPADLGRFRVLSDVPALDGDDPLDFEAIAGRLERIILASRRSTPFTISIEAGWGAGKSTLMRRVERRLEGRASDQSGPVADVKTVWFNAWAAPQGQALEGLVRSVLDQLDTNVLRRIARKHKLIRGLRLGLSVLAGLLRIGNVVDRIWDQVSVDPKQRNELNDFVRDAMETWLRKTSSTEGRLIVVFVDDLDRCTAATVLQVFEAMKLYLDAPGFVFVLGWDTEQVLRAVAQEKGAEDRLPERYVEKIVQFGFRIPRPNDDQLGRLAAALCDASGLSEQVFAIEHRQLLINTTDGNPRQLKRFINRFILLHEIVGEDTDAALVIQLMVLQVSYDNFFRLLADVPGDEDEDNPLFEFAEYVLIRQAVARGQAQRAAQLLTARGFEDVGDGLASQFQSYVENLPADYPRLATDRQFNDLVVGMSDDVKRELRRLARSDEVRAVEPSMADASKRAPAYHVDQSAAVAPGTTVLWIDEDTKRPDPALLPSGVNLLVATSNDEARRLLASRQEPVAMLISDIGRGGDPAAGLDGLRGFRHDHLHDGPAVFYTLRPTSGQVEDASTLGADVPSSPDELRSIVQRHLPTSRSGWAA